MNSELKCTVCGEVHQSYPVLTFAYPNSYYWLTDTQKDTYPIHMDSDCCTIEYPDRTDYFIRSLLKQKIAGTSLYLHYDLWVAVSAEDFEDYTGENSAHQSGKLYLGWLANAIPEYQFDKSIPVDVKTVAGRPEIYPLLDLSHPFVKDFYHGITKEEANKRIHTQPANISF